jgi:hypothetical protein
MSRHKSRNKFKHLPDGTTVIFLEQRDGASFNCYIDTEDFPLVAAYRWCAAQGWTSFYAYTNSQGTTRAMHQLLMPSSDGRTPDHVDRDGLNNRRSNLRLATKSQQAWNWGLLANNTSGVAGVHLHKKSRKWMARIAFNHKRIYLGSFSTLAEAAAARSQAVELYHGEFGVPVVAPNNEKKRAA